jgi:hypothetical protein
VQRLKVNHKTILNILKSCLVNKVKNAMTYKHLQTAIRVKDPSPNTQWIQAASIPETAWNLWRWG